MKVFITLFILAISTGLFAQSDKTLVISFQQVSEATTLQQLVPNYFAEIENIKSYKTTLAISRQNLKECFSKGNQLNEDFKAAVLAQAESGNKVIVYFDNIRWGTDKITELPSKVVMVE